MSDDKSRAEKDQWRLPSKDITPVLKGWDYEAGTINVRKVSGLDGSPKLQMRLDLGLLQMEMSGRPDGPRQAAGPSARASRGSSPLLSHRTDG